MAKGYELTREITLEKKRAFILALASTGRVDKAAETIGTSRFGIYKVRERDANFAAAWDEAKRVSGLALEDEAMRRGVEGIDEKIFYKGDVVDTIKKYSDTLLIFLMKGAMPDKYADRTKQEVSGGVTINVITGVPPADAEFKVIEEKKISYDDASDLC